MYNFHWQWSFLLLPCWVLSNYLPNVSVFFLYFIQTFYCQHLRWVEFIPIYFFFILITFNSTKLLDVKNVNYQQFYNSMKYLFDNLWNEQMNDINLISWKIDVGCWNNCFLWTDLWKFFIISISNWLMLNDLLWKQLRIIMLCNLFFLYNWWTLHL